MKHLSRISLTWAIVVLILASGKLYLLNKDIQYKIDQQKLVELHLQNKKAELDLLNKLQGSAGSSYSSPSKQARDGSGIAERIEIF